MEQRVLVVIGTRPEAIKLAPVIKQLETRRALRPVICVTGQHREMVDDVLRLFAIAPDHDLDIMKRHQTASGVFAAVLERIEPVIKSMRPQLAIVQGDTTTTAAAALAAFHERVPVGHVEAGLRTDNIYDPFPEELNRRLVTQLATLHFAATARAARRLLAEGTAADRVHLTGNPVVDAVHWIRSHGTLRAARSGHRSILVTAHRRENLGAPLERICAALRRLVAEHDDVEIVYPVHPNPLVTGPVNAALGAIPRIRLLPPVSYDELLGYMDDAYLVLTDSGGLQEEATVLGRPVLIMRETTERQEAIEAGAAELVGTDPDTIVGRATTLLRDEDAYAAMATPRELFGDGHAAERIVSTSEEFLRSTASAPQASLRVLPSERPDGIVLEAWPSSAATG
jgi:UDP-N-acetylglucosamine 2-epimerase (non-hydrolysing)